MRRVCTLNAKQIKIIGNCQFRNRQSPSDKHYVCRKPKGNNRYGNVGCLFERKGKGTDLPILKLNPSNNHQETIDKTSKIV